MDRFCSLCPLSDCQGGVDGAEDVAEDAAGGSSRAFRTAFFGKCFGSGALCFAIGAEGKCFGSGALCFAIGAEEEDAAEDAAEEVCNGKRDCTDCSDRWDPCEWWGFLAAACAVRFKRSAMSRTASRGMSRKQDMSASQDSSS